MSNPTPCEILTEMAHTFAEKVPANYTMAAAFEIATGEVDPFHWHIRSIDGEVEWAPGSMEDPDTTFTLSSATLLKIHDGTWNGMTAAGRAHVRDPAPLNFTLPRDVHPLEAMRRGYFFLTHFFSVDNPTRVNFGPQHTRKIHGAGATALFYHQGMRSAYYCITADDVLNEDGARDPMHQAFIVIGGEGTAIIGETETEVSMGQALYVPPDTVHMLRTGGPDPLEIIWLAWGEGA